MKKVRFLESCFMFSTRVSHDANSVTFIDEEQANKLYKRGMVDFLEDEDYIDEETSEKDKSELNLEDKTVKELKELATKHDIPHSNMKKAELVEALNEVF